MKKLYFIGMLFAGAIIGIGMWFFTKGELRCK